MTLAKSAEKYFGIKNASLNSQFNRQYTRRLQISYSMPSLKLPRQLLWILWQLSQGRKLFPLNLEHKMIRLEKSELIAQLCTIPCVRKFNCFFFTIPELDGHWARFHERPHGINPFHCGVFFQKLENTPLILMQQLAANIGNSLTIIFYSGLLVISTPYITQSRKTNDGPNAIQTIN